MMDQVCFTTNNMHKSQHVECWYIQELGEMMIHCALKTLEPTMLPSPS